MEAAIAYEAYLRQKRLDQLAVWRCGWCKGFIHEARVSDMQRWVHDEPPATAHEVLPYRVP